MYTADFRAGWEGTLGFVWVGLKLLVMDDGGGGGLALDLGGIARGLVNWEELEVKLEAVRGGAEGTEEGIGPDVGADMTFFAYDVCELIFTFLPGFKLTWLTSWVLREGNIKEAKEF